MRYPKVEGKGRVTGGGDNTGISYPLLPPPFSKGALCEDRAPTSEIAYNR